MKLKLLTGATIAAALSLPVVSHAQDGAAAGATTGAVTGAVVGGPLGAAVGAGVGAVAGGSADDTQLRFGAPCSIISLRTRSSRRRGPALERCHLLRSATRVWRDQVSLYGRQ